MRDGANGWWPEEVDRWQSGADLDALFAAQPAPDRIQWCGEWIELPAPSSPNAPVIRWGDVLIPL